MSSSLLDEDEVDRLMEDSEALALRLIQEESYLAYEASMASMFDFQVAHSSVTGDSDEDDDSDDDDDGDSLSTNRDLYGISDGEMSYNELLELGDEIGDVKEERWRAISSDYIRKFEMHAYSEHPSDGKITDFKCLVCMIEYSSSDVLSVLPCRHAYHKECIGKWICFKDTCPLCKKSVAA